jgi:hypothetical protein
LVQVVVELQPAMCGHPVRPGQPPLLDDALMPPELLLPEGAPEEDPPEEEPPDEDPPLLPPSALPSSRALPPHAKAIDAATPKARSMTDAGTRSLMPRSV